MEKKTVEVCLTPALLGTFETAGKIIVVIDIFRASSAICTAMHHGVKEIIPVCTTDEAHDYKTKGYIVAAERNGAVVNGFDFGNSPFAYMNGDLKGKTVVLTTTNCTSAIHEIKDAHQILIGSFVNITALTDYLKSQEYNVLLLCAGWKNRVSLEDSVFAGALTDRLSDSGFELGCDGAVTAVHLYREAKPNLRKFIDKSSYTHRIKFLDIEKDIAYCLIEDQVTAIPHFNGSSISPLFPG